MQTPNKPQLRSQIKQTHKHAHGRKLLLGLTQRSLSLSPPRKAVVSHSSPDTHPKTPSRSAAQFSPKAFLVLMQQLLLQLHRRTVASKQPQPQAATLQMLQHPYADTAADTDTHSNALLALMQQTSCCCFTMLETAVDKPQQPPACDTCSALRQTLLLTQTRVPSALRCRVLLCLLLCRSQ